MNNKLLLGIFGALILITTLALMFSTSRERKLKQEVDNQTSYVEFLNENVSALQAKIHQSDSVFNLQQAESMQLKESLHLLEVRKSQIETAYKKIKATVAKQTASEAMDYFKCSTNSSFPTMLVNAMPDSSFEVPLPAIKLANDKFVSLDEEEAISDNLRQQNVVLVDHVSNLEFQVHNRQEKIAALENAQAVKNRQIDLLTENVKNYQSIVKKSHRRETFYKIATTAGVILSAILILN